MYIQSRVDTYEIRLSVAGSVLRSDGMVQVVEGDRDDVVYTAN